MEFDAQQLLATLSQTRDKAELTRLLVAARDYIMSEPLSQGSHLARLDTLSDVIDAVIRSLFSIECAAIGYAPDTLNQLSILATGGYGRRELAPYSDVDLTFLAAHEDDDHLNAIIKGMFQGVMDVFLYGAGIKVGYGYRLAGDFGQLDHQTQTAMLDARLIVGSENLFTEFTDQFRKQLLVADFLFQKNAERSAVIVKMTPDGGSAVPFVVEPNVKESPGGLRDGQMVEWFGQAIGNVPREDALAALERRSLISPEQSHAFTRTYNFLRLVRMALHCVARDGKDRLTAEKQEQVAGVLGYVDQPDSPAVEQFMVRYYANVGTMRRISTMVVQRCCDSRLNLGVAGLSSVDRKVVVTSADAASVDSVLPLHICELAQAYRLGYGDNVGGDVEAFIAQAPAPARPDLCGRVLWRILGAAQGVAESARWLADSFVLTWCMPELTGLRELIPYDAAHEYTVGEHSLRVVDFLEQLRLTDDPKLAEYRRAWDEVTAPEVLFMAGLLHDVGKKWPQDGSHAEVGARVAEQIARRFGWHDEPAQLLVFLIRNHLLMAETSRLRDLGMDETIRDFTQIVDTPAKLHMLYLLTYADTHSVGNGVWTDMQNRFLSELFGRADTALAQAAALVKNTRNESEPSAAFVPDLAKHRERVKRQLAQQNLPPDAIHEHTATMSAQYLLNTTLDEMYLHMAMINRLRATMLPCIDFRNETGSDFTELTIVAYDEQKPGLLAKIFGVLYALDVNLHAAQVFTRDSSIRIAIDTLWIDFRGKPLSNAKKSEVQDTIRAVLSGAETIHELHQKRKKSTADQTVHSAKIDDSTSERYSLVDVRAPMEQGVLYRVASAISELAWNIHSARLSLWGSRLRAAFYVTNADRRKVPAEDVAALLEKLRKVDAPKNRALASHHLSQPTR